jgi:hypothetical protein
MLRQDLWCYQWCRFRLRWERKAHFMLEAHHKSFRKVLLQRLILRASRIRSD